MPMYSMEDRPGGNCRMAEALQLALPSPGCPLRLAPLAENSEAELPPPPWTPPREPRDGTSAIPSKQGGGENEVSHAGMSEGEVKPRAERSGVQLRRWRAHAKGSGVEERWCRRSERH
jgi:hypothetical protein